jgi:hypothetical protein
MAGWWRSPERTVAALLNPDPLTYRLTEVCLVCGGEQAYTALLARSRSMSKRVGARLRDGVAWRVEPVMTREMLDTLVCAIGLRSGLRARWVWNGEAVLTDNGDGQRWLRPDVRGLYAVGAFTTVGGYDWTWAEVTPPWPGGDVSAAGIVGLLTAPVPNTWPIANQIKAKAGILELADALHATDDRVVRERICHLLAHRERGDGALAIPALLEMLRAQHPGLRSEAADAIAQISTREGSDAVRAVATAAGAVALDALTVESDARARAMLAGALGALRYEPSIALLVALLADHDWLVRREAASALGALRAAVAEQPLQRALLSESDPHAAEAVRAALAAITGKALFVLSPSAARAWPLSLK